MLWVPWTTKGTLPLDIQRGIGLLHDTVVYIDAILVLECRVRTLPSSDATSTAA